MSWVVVIGLMVAGALIGFGPGAVFGTWYLKRYAMRMLAKVSEEMAEPVLVVPERKRALAPLRLSVWIEAGAILNYELQLMRPMRVDTFAIRPKELRVSRITIRSHVGAEREVFTAVGKPATIESVNALLTNGDMPDLSVDAFDTFIFQFVNPTDAPLEITGGLLGDRLSTTQE